MNLQGSETLATNELYPEFTPEMKKTHTILIPNALPVHFSLMGSVFRDAGYNVAFLDYSGQKVIDTGLKYVHNDACYPAIVVIGQLIYALESGDFDPQKSALMLYQTGGGCRASNYVHMLRKALKKAGLAYVPVVSVYFGGIEKNSGCDTLFMFYLFFVRSVRRIGRYTARGRRLFVQRLQDVDDERRVHP